MRGDIDQSLLLRRSIGHLVCIFVMYCSVVAAGGGQLVSVGALRVASPIVLDGGRTLGPPCGAVATPGVTQEPRWRLCCSSAAHRQPNNRE
jgi:hypothetical protein